MGLRYKGKGFYLIRVSEKGYADVVIVSSPLT
jgi:hypothetical protein